MSDHSFLSHRRRKATIILGVSRTRKYSRVALALFAVLLLGSAYIVIFSGAFTDDSPGISQKVYEQINAARQAGGIPPVLIEGSLTSQAKTQSVQMKLTPLAYSSSPSAGSGAVEDVNTLPKCRGRSPSLISRPIRSIRG